MPESARTAGAGAALRRAAAGCALALALAVPAAGQDDASPAPAHGIAMHGAPLYGPDFTHFAYVDPDAPKGGSLTLGAIGSFDSLNPLIVKGVAAHGIRDYVYESLMARSFDEPFSLYGLLAESVRVPPDRSWIEFTLRPEARFSDGRPVRVEDVIFSHALLRDQGRPNHRYYYGRVARVERPGPRAVRFVFAADGDREMPLIMGLMPVLPEHATDPERFTQTGFDIPLGSGPYTVGAVDPGNRIVYRRDPGYWGRDLAVNRGRFNFDTVVYEYFRDDNSLFEAFRRGIVQIRPEEDPQRWKSGYDFAAAARGEVVRDSFSYGVPAGMSALVFNTRRPPFDRPEVRRALMLLFDFEWMNRTLFHDAYVRMQSYFDPSELASAGHPVSERERELLAPWLDRLPAALIDGTHRVPEGDGTGRDRNNRRTALALFETAGYRLADGKVAHAASGVPLSFEILAATRDQERLALSYARSLALAGITVRVRQVDSTQYQRRRQTFDFDMVFNRWYASLSPGNEQSVFWGAAAADEEGSRNYAGIRDPAIDTMIARLLEAETREDFVAAARALDRLLLAGDYVIPLYYLPHQWVARWSAIGRPERTSLFGYMIDTWWHQQAGGAGEAAQQGR